MVTSNSGGQARVGNEATPTPSPLRFDLPTPGAEPVSGWRPPLYPLPWAVSPYDHFYFARPIAADNVNWPLAEYRYGGIFFDNVVHTGVDIPDDEGTPWLPDPGQLSGRAGGCSPNHRSTRKTRTDRRSLSATISDIAGSNSLPFTRTWKR